MMNLPAAVLTGGGATSIQDVMNNTAPMGDRLAYGLQMTAIGLLTVFAVLGIIYLVMLIFRLVFSREPAKTTQTAPVEPTAPLSAPVTKAELRTAPAAPAAPTAPAAADDALIAVLTAAVAAVLADEAAAAGTEALPFRVVSFRRTTKGRGWNAKS